MGQVFVADGTTTTDSAGRQVADKTITVTGGAGNFTIWMTEGITGTVTSGTAAITGSVVTLSAGLNTLTADGNGTCTLDITIGTAANWNTVNNWSAASGGTGGATVPTLSDNVYFDANSFSAGSQVVTVDATSYCSEIDWTGATNTPTLSIADQSLRLYGDVTFIAAMVITSTTGGLNFRFAGDVNLTTNGLSLDCTFRKTGGLGKVTLADNLTVTSASATAIDFIIGELDTAGFTVNVTGGIQFSGATAQTVTLGASVINCSAWNMTGTNQTMNAGTSTIKVTGTGVFTGNGKTYHNVELNGTAHTISGDNTFSSLTIANTATVTLAATTQTTGAWINSGTIAATTGKIIVTGTGVFTGGGETYYDVELNGTAHTISGSNTFNSLVLPSGTTQTITFTDGTNQTMATATLSGSVGHVHTLQGSGAAGWAITKTGGGVSSHDWLDLAWSNGSPTTNTWFYLANSVAANVTGWNAWAKALSDTMTITDSIVKDIGKPESDTMAIADSPSKGIGKPLSDSVVIADAIVKEMGKPYSETMTIADSFSRVVEYKRSFTDTMTISDVLSKALGKPLADNMTITDALSKAIGIIGSETMAIADSIVKDIGLGKADTLAITDALSKAMSKDLADAIAIVDSMVMTGSYARPGINVAAFLYARAINSLLYNRDINAKSRREF